ncbi:MAG: hypothetical protein EZS28_027372 [Streblomastix strix]|uniref:Uncharacterized protein n=1 Tax=Streblomastix strix TaxID=222440 RepID=A0A5J4V3W0_9EUKA|nr:MAG: hypothetical protein EZS28_027372 [Streblomastix strix]
MAGFQPKVNQLQSLVPEQYIKPGIMWGDYLKHCSAKMKIEHIFLQFSKFAGKLVKWPGEVVSVQRQGGIGVLQMIFASHNDNDEYIESDIYFNDNIFMTYGSKLSVGAEVEVRLRLVSTESIDLL